MRFVEKLKNNLNLYNLVAIVLGAIVGFVYKGTENSIFGLDQIRTIGDSVLMIMSWLAIPLIFFLIIHIVSQVRDIKQHSPVIVKVIIYFLGTSLIACIIGILVALAFKHWGLFQRLSLISNDYIDITPQMNFLRGVSNITIADLVDGILKENFVMIAIFSSILGLAVAKSGDAGEAVGKFVDAVNIVMEKMASFMVMIAPVGVFAMTAKLVFDYRIVKIGQVFWLAVALQVGYLLHVLVTYCFALKFFAKISIWKFFKRIFPAIAFAMTTQSSLSCIPISTRLSDTLGARKSVSGLVIPAGYISNMDGTVIYLAICTIFFATGLGVSLSFWQLMLMMLVIILTEFGASGVPHAGLVMLFMVMKVLGLDLDLILLIVELDIFFDIGRTCLNVIADLVTVVCTEEWCKEKESLS